MSAEPKIKMTAEEYLVFERASEERHEFYRGEIFAMSGASRKHNIISLNFASALKESLRGSPCRPFMGDMRLWMMRHEHYVYPDVMVVCGEQAFKDEDTATDATLIAEVLSPSTESYDRGTKFLHYQSMPSLKEYILISQEQLTVEVYARETENKWQYTILNRKEDLLTLPSISFSISLTDLYDGTRV